MKNIKGKFAHPHSPAPTPRQWRLAGYSLRQYSFRSLNFPLWLLLLLPFAAQAQFNYVTNNDSITITRYTGVEVNVTIPSSINGLAVTAIGDWAFAERAVISVIIPDSLTSIGDSAFSDCYKLTNVVIPYSGLLNIGKQAFHACDSLPRVTTPISVTNIGAGAFSNCESLTNVAIGDSVATIGDSAFTGCPKLAAIIVSPLNHFFCSVDGVLFNAAQTVLIQYPGGKPGSYTIPPSVTEVGDYAFAGCPNLTSVTIPSSVTSIGESAFALSAKLTAITVDPLNAFYSSADGALLNKSGTMLIQFPLGKAGSYTIPNGTISIEPMAFYRAANLINLTIPNSVTTIGNYAFGSCSNLTSLVVPDGVTTMEYGAFFECQSLTNVTIGNGLTSLEAFAFYACVKLTSLILPNGVTNIGPCAFESCERLTTLTLPASLTSIGDSAFSRCLGLTSITIPNSVTQIGRHSFSSCSSLTDVTIGNSVTAIGSYAFYACTSLALVTIGSSVTSIDYYAFAFCPKLARVYFQGNAPTMGTGAFDVGMPAIYHLPGTTGWGPTPGAPGPVTLLSPLDVLDFTNRCPTFTWSHIGFPATWCRLCLLRNGATYQDRWFYSDSTWTPSADLPAGSYSWWVLPWNDWGLGAWSAPGYFTIQTCSAGAPVLVCPNTNEVQTTPLLRYAWSADPCATWYRLYISRNGQLFADTWHASGKSVLPSTDPNFAVDISNHSSGVYRWWVVPWGPDGYGTWSAAGTFTKAYRAPGAITLLQPANGSTATTGANLYTWSHDPCATYYRLYISRNNQPFVDTWYSRDQSVLGATTNFSVNVPGHTSGAYKWWVLPWGPDGFGPWSTNSSFAVP